MVSDHGLGRGQTMAWWTFRIFFNFCFSSERGKGESKAPGGGGVVFIEIPGGGAVSGGRGQEGVCSKLGNFLGGV